MRPAADFYNADKHTFTGAANTLIGWALQNTSAAPGTKAPNEPNADGEVGFLSIKAVVAIISTVVVLMVVCGILARNKLKHDRWLQCRETPDNKKGEGHALLRDDTSHKIRLDGNDGRSEAHAPANDNDGQSDLSGDSKKQDTQHRATLTEKKPTPTLRERLFGVPTKKGSDAALTAIVTASGRLEAGDATTLPCASSTLGSM